MIEKSTRFFNATIKDILNELLQNSRRAGALKIDISLIENGMLSLTDDGVGCSAMESHFC
jgi:DNA mismatch repair ATPase MutL